MKRWIILFAVSYVVTTTSSTYRTMDGDKTVIGYEINGYPCGSTKEMCKDMSAALNDAHNRRVNTAIEPIEKCVSECLGR